MKDLLKLQNGSDVRGVAVEGVAGEPVTLTPDDVQIMCQSFTLWLAEVTDTPVNKLKIGVGHDSRISADKLKAAALAGITATGAKAVDCGMATTPAMFMSLVFPETALNGSLMLTASHLPFNRNGIKFFEPKNGGMEKQNLRLVLEQAMTMELGTAKPENIEKVALIDIYADFINKFIREGIDSKTDYEQPLKGMHIVVDAGNGAGGFFASKVLEVLGADTEGSVFLDPNGFFPNHVPNPEDAKAMASIRKAVLDNKADLGLIFDTDVDRMSAVLADGKEVNKDALIAMMSAILAPEYPGSTIVTDSVTSDKLTKFLEEELGLKHLRYQRGYKNVINKCKELNNAGIVSPLAIETSGHGALKDNYYLDDGAFMAVRLLIALAKVKAQGGDLATLIEKFEPPFETKEYRFKLKGEDFRAYGEMVLTEFKKRAGEAGYHIVEPNYEGIRLQFDTPDAQGWALLRQSLHDPNMPLNIEGNQTGHCRNIAVKIRDLLAGFDKLDTSCIK